MGTKMKWAWWAAVAGAATLGIDAMRDVDYWSTLAAWAGHWVQAAWAVDGFAWYISDIIETWWEALSNIVPYADVAAPFAFPAIAGAKWAHILASKYGPDSKMFRALATVTGWALWWAASMLVAWKYLALAWLGYTVWKSPKALNWIAKKWVSIPVQGFKWLWDGVKRWKNVYNANNWGSWVNWVYA